MGKFEIKAGKVATIGTIAVLLLVAAFSASSAELGGMCGVYERQMQAELVRRGYVEEANTGDYQCVSDGNRLFVTVGGFKEVMYCGATCE